MAPSSSSRDWGRRRVPRRGRRGNRGAGLGGRARAASGAGVVDRRGERQACKTQGRSASGATGIAHGESRTRASPGGGLRSWQCCAKGRIPGTRVPRWICVLHCRLSSGGHPCRPIPVVLLRDCQYSCVEESQVTTIEQGLVCLLASGGRGVGPAAGVSTYRRRRVNSAGLFPSVSSSLLLLVLGHWGIPSAR